MKKNSRIILRLPQEQRKQIDNLIEEKKFKNVSEVVRAALSEFLKEKQLISAWKKK